MTYKVGGSTLSVCAYDTSKFLRIRSLDFHMKSWVGECKILMELNFLMKIFALWASGLGLYIAYKRLIDTE